LANAFEMPHPANASLVATNTTGYDRLKEVISVPMKDFGNIHREFYAKVYWKHQSMVVQLINHNNDLYWDELLLEVSILAHATDTFTISWERSGAQPAHPVSTQVFLSRRSNNNTAMPEITGQKRSRGFIQDIAKPFYQMEGPGIENDKVAFRSFFDYRNGKDIYGKLVDTPVLSKVGLGASWHQLQSWGMDILKVGKSLGAGALAVKDGASLYPLADADTAYFEELYEGELQAAFQLNFINWDAGTKKMDGREQISISKGEFYYSNHIHLPLPTSQLLVSGLANFGNYPLVFKQHNARLSSISTYGKQADGTNTGLGLALLFESANYVSHHTIDTGTVIANTSYVALKQPGNQQQVMYVFACWEKTDARFQTPEGFRRYLQRQADLLANPIIGKVISQLN